MVTAAVDPDDAGDQDQRHRRQDHEAAGYMNNGLMILPPMALILIACIIWVHRSRHHELWEEE